MSPLACLHFGLLPDGAALCVAGEHVLQYLDTTPPSFVPQPGGRRGVLGVAALSWSGVDHAPVAIVDVAYALDLTPRPASAGAILLVRGSSGIVGGLLTDPTSRPPRYESIPGDQAPTSWEVHPHLGNVLRRCPVPDPVTHQSVWMLDPAVFFTRLCHA